MPLNSRSSRRRTYMVRKRFEVTKGTDVASATSITLPNDGNVFTLTGTTTTTYIATDGWQAGSRITLIPDGSVTLTNNGGAAGTGYANMLSASGSNISAAANKCYSFIYNGTSWIQD